VTGRIAREKPTARAAAAIPLQRQPERVAFVAIFRILDIDQGDVEVPHRWLLNETGIASSIDASEAKVLNVT
jgi:hypothetical protein